MPLVAVQMHWSVRIPLRDGTQLTAILYAPAGAHDPSPAIMAMTPYVAQSYHSQGMFFAGNGYPFLIVDVRGRGNSGGAFHPLNEAQDGCDVVEWLAAQPYCNGKVAMWGSSYLGYCQWAVARQCPMPLATIVPAAAACYGVDVPLLHNIFVTYTIQWLTGVSGRALQDKIAADRQFWMDKFRSHFETGAAFAQLDTWVGNPSSLFQEWLAHPQLDEYWDRYNSAAEQYATLSIPILTITGAYDGDQPGALEHYSRHLRTVSDAARARHFLIIGPWGHSGTQAPKAEFDGLKVGPASLFDLQNLHLQWYDWTLRGGARPEFLKRNVAYYVTGAEEWRYADTLEAVTAGMRPLYLRSAGNPVDVFRSGSLAAEPTPTSRPDTYIYDPRDVSHAALEATLPAEFITDQRMLLATSGARLIYHSAPFAGQAEICGFFKLSAWLAIDQSDTDFLVTVYDVATDGTAVRLASDWLRARHREGLRTTRLIATTEPLRYDFERFMFVARRIAKGHRLRLVVGPINSIHVQKNYNSGSPVCEETIDDARVVTVTLFHDTNHPSALYVPLGATTQ
jgi:uncharacterized protein